MSTRLLLRGAAWAFAAVGFAALLGAALKPPVSVPRTAAPASDLSDTMGPRPATGLDSVAAVVIRRDLFRRSRTPGPAFSTPPASPATGAVARPSLRLVGLIAGEKPTAVIEGLPGTAGPRVVRFGDVVGGLTVGKIEESGVHVAGMDTTWVLTVRRP